MFAKKNNFLLVEGQALAYVQIDFSSIEEFLARMSRARRKDIRRKLKSRHLLDIDVVPIGHVIFEDDRFVNELYELYLNVYHQSNIHFDKLSESFFKGILREKDDSGVVFIYRADGHVIGYNICFIKDDLLIDKYVGFLYPQARQYNLYMVSWFYNLEYAAARGLRCYVAGWTDPEIKRYLGASFTLTRHAVYIRNPVLRKLLGYFKHLFEADHNWYVNRAVPDNS